MRSRLVGGVHAAWDSHRAGRGEPRADRSARQFTLFAWKSDFFGSAIPNVRGEPKPEARPRVRFVTPTRAEMSARAVGLLPRGGLASRPASSVERDGTPGRRSRPRPPRMRAFVSPAASGECRSGHRHATRDRRPVSLRRGPPAWSPQGGTPGDTVARKAFDSAAPTDAAPPAAIDPSAVTVRVTADRAELRGAAAARALAFYTYPTDRSEFSIRSHRNMRIDAEWDAIADKINGKDVAFRDTRVACLVVSLALEKDGALPPGFAFDGKGMDPAALIPADAKNGAPPRLILGTLDVNQGSKLPAEELAGTFPGPEDPVPPGTNISEDGKGTNAGEYADEEDSGDSEGAIRPIRYRRAYLSNVCVLASARRLGLGKKLIDASFEVAKSWGVEHMYVHVEAENVGAKRFYEAEGFVVESEETEAFALSLSRPRRFLLAQPVDARAED